MKTWAVGIMFGLLVGCGSGTPSEPVQSAAAPQAPPSKAPDENAALDAVGKLNEAQSLYFKRNRRYALAYDELIESRLLNSEPTAAETGYRLNLRPTADAQTYTVSVVPASPSPSARHFFSDQSGVIRAEQGKDATAQSPKISK